MPDDLAFQSARALSVLIRRRELSSLELTRHFIDRIERLDGDINAVVVRTFERALKDAEAADSALARGEVLGQLHGIPMTVKESYVIQDTATTWGIPSQRNNIASRDGLAVSRFRRAGALFLGKTNVPVDLSDIQSSNEIFGTTNNPWNLERTPGGSSGGSAAAIAAGFSALEAGSDIAGSIRTPAHFCGVYGHKPTWGIVPLSGHELIEGVPDPDVSVCGPLARDASDLALALDIMAGPTEREAVGWRLELPKSRFRSLRELRVAIWPTHELAPVDDEIAAKVVMVGETLARLGAKVSDGARPELDWVKAHHTYLSLTSATMSSGQPAEQIARTQKYVDTLDRDNNSCAAVDARAAVMSHRQWLRHHFRREKLRRAWDSFFRDWDLLIYPQAAVTALKHDARPLGKRSVMVNGEERPCTEQLFWAGLANAPFLPSTVFPTGTSSEGLPIGIQVTAPAYHDHDSIEFARLITHEIGGFTPPPALSRQR